MSGAAAEGEGGAGPQGAAERRRLRARYLAVKNLISGKAFPPPRAWFPDWVWVVVSSDHLRVGVCCIGVCADERDEMAKPDSDKFSAIITQVDCLHELGKGCSFHFRPLFYSHGFEYISYMV
jgi:non-structural maintenance of chromosomes element 4